LLNVPVYSCCFIKHYLLIGSYKNIIVINLECKENGKEKFCCVRTILVQAFYNPKVLMINSVMRMYADTRRSVVLMVKRNGYIYTLDESKLKSKLLSPTGSSLQEAVMQICEVSDKVNLLKSNLNVTEMYLKQINIAINLFLNVNLCDESNSLINCQLLSSILHQKKRDIGIKLELECSEAKLSTNGWFLSVHVTYPKFYHISSFYPLSSFNHDEIFTQHLKLSTKDLPFQVTCVVYCDFVHAEFFNAKEAVGISTVLKQEKFNILNFLKELNSNTMQYPLCSIEGYITLTKQSWERLEKNSKKNLLLKMLLVGADNQFTSFVVHKANITEGMYVHKINKEECVIAKFLTSSIPFVCELRAAIVEKLNVSACVIFYS